MVMDTHGNILAMNPAAERLTGYAAEELIGSNCRELNCTGCKVFGRGPGKDWCSLFEKGVVKDKKCLILFTSARAWEICMQWLEYFQTDLRAFGKSLIAAVGPGTAEAIRKNNIQFFFL